MNELATQRLRHEVEALWAAAPKCDCGQCEDRAVVVVPPRTVHPALEVPFDLEVRESSLVLPGHALVFVEVRFTHGDDCGNGLDGHTTQWAVLPGARADVLFAVPLPEHLANELARIERDMADDPVARTLAELDAIYPVLEDGGS